MYADKFHTKTTPPKFMSADTYAEKQARFGADKAMKFREFQQQFGTPDLVRLSEKYSFDII